MLHLAVLWTFVGGTAMLLLAAIVSRLRVRRPLLVWRPGPLTRFPVGPSLFLLLVGLTVGGTALTGRPLPATAVVGYPAGALFWFAAMWLARTVVVTEYGLVPDVPRGKGRVAWSQIVDYESVSRNGQSHFVFYYRSRGDEDRRQLELPVPEQHVGEFRRLVRTKLKTRPACSDRSVALEEATRRN